MQEKSIRDRLNLLGLMFCQISKLIILVPGNFASATLLGCVVQELNVSKGLTWRVLGQQLWQSSRAPALKQRGHGFFPTGAGAVLFSLSILSNVALKRSLKEVQHYCFSYYMKA